MYNTIEVMPVHITKAEIRFFKKGRGYSTTNEGLRHVKVLPYLSVVQSVDGSYDIALGGGEACQTGQGGFFVAPSDVRQTIVHHVNPQSGRMICRWVFLDVQINDGVRIDTRYRFPVTLEEPYRSRMHVLFERLFASDGIWENYSCCYEIMGLLLQTATPIPQSTFKGGWRAVEYIREHYREPITVADLANAAAMSPSNLYAVFRKELGCSPITFLNHYRLSLAAELLRETDDTVGEVGYAVGIEDPLYFSKCFKRTYGASPSAYRAANRANPPEMHG